MPILELTLQSTFYNQEVINRWNYVSSGTPAAVSLSYALAYAFGTIYDLVAVPPGYPTGKPFEAIRNIQSSLVVYDQVTVVDMYSETDFYETPFIQAAAGARGGECLPPTAAVGFRTGRVRRDIRRGTKRFAGLPEADTSNNTFAGPYQALLTTLASRMSAPLTYNDEGNTITFTPAILGRELYTPDPLRPERKAYRPYATETLQMQHLAQGFAWDWYSGVRTQVSRQIGRGR